MAIASVISAQLRRLGFSPAAASDRKRQGLRVTNTWDGRARVCADLDAPSEAARLSEAAEEALRRVGRETERTESDTFYVNQW